MGQLQVLAALLSVFPQIGLSKPCETTYPPLMHPLQSRQFSDNLGAVASESEICSTIGVNILRGGGNAADAMVATVLCVGTIGKKIHPSLLFVLTVQGMYHSGIGGGGFMLIHAPDEKNGSNAYEFVDFRETAPAAATENMFKNNVNESISGGKARYVNPIDQQLQHLTISQRCPRRIERSPTPTRKIR